MRIQPVVALLLVLGSWGCDGESPSAPDAAVTVAVRTPLEMPFHGPRGPGTEPISISFEWTVEVAAAGGAVTVVLVRTELVEEATDTVISLIDTRPDGTSGRVVEGVPLRVPQSASGFFGSALYPGRWEGETLVEVRHPTGRVETLRTAFAFR